MKRDSFNVLFFIKKAKLLKNGEASVCMRITVNGARVENNIRKSIEPSLWNQAKECAKGKSRKSCDLNAYIEDARIKLYQTFNELEEQGRFITARLLQEKFFGQDQVPEVVRTLIQTIQEHNDQCRKLVGKDYALITVRRYESCKRYLAELIKLKYGKEDLPLLEVNGELVRAFEFYLKTEKECQQNTVIRYMKCLKKITNLALANEWITKDPFIGIKFHEKEVIREFLTMDELLTIYHKEFPLERITIVRDVFIFAAFTGLAFIDVRVAYIDVPEHPGNKVIAMHFDGWVWGEHPHTFHGCPYFKVESTTKVMPQDMYDERIRAHQPQLYAWERLAADGVALADLDENLIRNSIRRGIDGGRIPESALYESTGDILSKWKLLKNGVPTNGAVLLFSNNIDEYPQFTLRMARFVGTNKNMFRDINVLKVISSNC